MGVVCARNGSVPPPYLPALGIFSILRSRAMLFIFRVWKLFVNILR